MHATVISLFIITLACILGCCHKPKKSNEHSALPLAHVLPSLNKLNIAFCPGSHCVTMSDKEIQNRSFTLTSTLHKSDVLHFYAKDMEIRGWQIIDLSSDDIGVLSCQAGSRSCVVVVEQQTATSSSIKLFMRSL